MSPDDHAERIRSLENRVAVLGSRLDDLTTDVHALTPLVVQNAEINGRLESVGRRVDQCSVDTQDIKAELRAQREQRQRDWDQRAKDREEANARALEAAQLARKERSDNLKIQITIGVTVLGILITAIFQLLGILGGGA